MFDERAHELIEQIGDPNDFAFSGASNQLSPPD